ncbi:hypothetical protein JA1_003322 [Spathaspora sp. JA1]|nr:hypothetical protein JA1_003322 [Spathaspora sp. JA1]
MTLSIDTYSFEELEEMYNDAVTELRRSYYQSLGFHLKQLSTLCKIKFTNSKSRKKTYENKWLNTQMELCKKQAEVWEWRKIINVIMSTMKERGFINSEELRRLHSGLMGEITEVEQHFASVQDNMLCMNQYENEGDGVVLSLLEEYPELGKQLKQLEKPLVWRYNLMKREGQERAI